MADNNDAPTVGDIESGSIADDLRASFAQAEKEAAPEAAPEAVTTEAAPEGDKSEGEQDGRARDEKGRFIAKDGAAEQPEKVEGAAPEAAQESVPAAEEEEPLDPPVEWTLEQQEAFRTLPVNQQKFILDQVGGVAEKLTEAEKASGRFKALDEVLAPKREEWARDGLEEHVVLRQLFALTDYAKTKPAEFIQWFAQSKGINLGQFAPQPAAQPDPNDPYANDPVVQRVNQQLAAIQQRNAALEQQLQQLTGSLQTREQQERQAQQQQLDKQIATFASQMDDKGKSKHPYFPIVRNTMAIFLEKGQAADLDSAYDMACHANPDVRAKIAAAAKAEDQREQARKAREKAAAATKAGSSVSGAPGGRSEPQPTGDLRDDLRAAFAQHSGTPVIQ